MCYDVFISYHRDNNYFVGRLFKDLQEHYFNPFLDIKDIGSGRYDQQIYNAIDECKHFILVLSSNTLRCCWNPKDWVRKEVEFAIKKKKHIIVIQLQDFKYPLFIPDSLKPIKHLQAIFPSPETFDDSVNQVVDSLNDTNWTAYDDSVFEKNERYIRKKKFIMFICITVIFLLFLSFSYKAIKDEKVIQTCLLVRDASGVWLDTEIMSASVGDEIEYRIQVTGITCDDDPVITLDIDKSLRLVSGSLELKKISGEDVALLPDGDITEGIHIKSYTSENDVFIDFSLHVYNYDLSLSDNLLYTRMKTVNEEKVTDDYCVLEVSFIDKESNNDPLASGWGDSAGGRNVYSTVQVNDDYILGDTITFNSITDWIIGDERNFVGAIKDTGVPLNKDTIWHANEIFVTEEGTYIIRMYIHNDNPNGESAVAEDVYALFSLPTVTGRTLGVHGYIESSNALPERYWDGVTFKSNRDFYLLYVDGSATLINNGIGSADGYPLPNEIIVSQGAMIGYDKIDGRIPGGELYDATVLIKVKVIFPEE